jgi:hypothetical protein
MHRSKSYLLFIVVLISSVFSCKKEVQETVQCFEAGQQSSSLIQVNDSVGFVFFESDSLVYDLDADGIDDLKFLSKVSLHGDSAYTRSMHIIPLHGSFELLAEYRQDSIYYRIDTAKYSGADFDDTFYNIDYNCALNGPSDVFDSVYTGYSPIALNIGRCISGRSEFSNSPADIVISRRIRYHVTRTDTSAQNRIQNQYFVHRNGFVCGDLRATIPAYLGFRIDADNKHGWIHIIPSFPYGILVKSYAIED